jgi:hypothetical protein
MDGAQTQIIDSANALTPGCEVWMVAGLNESAWTRRIDWYLNFQMVRAEPHRAPELSEDLKRILQTSEMDAPVVTHAPWAPLMVASAGLLPNSKTIQVRSSPDGAPEKWVKSCHSIWSKLGRPRSRIFLPDRMRVDVFEKVWPSADRSAIECVNPRAE